MQLRCTSGGSLLLLLLLLLLLWKGPMLCSVLQGWVLAS
jgi:hypothetical protein